MTIILYLQSGVFFCKYAKAMLLHQTKVHGISPNSESITRKIFIRLSLNEVHFQILICQIFFFFDFQCK